MAKAANVQIVKRVRSAARLVTTIVRGDVGSVRAAVEAGAQRRLAGRRTGRQPHHSPSRRRRDRGVCLEAGPRPMGVAEVSAPVVASQPTRPQKDRIMKILVANLGSTSFKYRLFDMADERQLARGGIERIGSPESRCVVEIGGRRQEQIAPRARPCRGGPPVPGPVDRPATRLPARTRPKCRRSASRRCTAVASAACSG